MAENIGSAGVLGQRHRLLYKFGTPPWKDVYRKRCRERLANNRQNVLERFRFKDDVMPNGSSRTSCIRDLMRDEWKVFKRELQQSQHDDMIDVGIESESIDEVFSIFEEITAELLQEEHQILAEYEAGNQLDEAALQASIDCLTAHTVICPVCQKSQLFINKGVVFCSCGLRIDTEDAVTLEMVGSNLSEGVSQHAAHCGHAPFFSVVNQLGITNLVMTCPGCDFMFIVV